MNLLYRQTRLSKSLIKSCRCFLTKAYTTTTSENTKNSKHTPQLAKYKDKYNCVYKFNYINHLRLFSRMKIYQTAMSSVFGIASVLAYDAKIIEDLTTLLVINGSMVFALAMLLAISSTYMDVHWIVYGCSIEFRWMFDGCSM